MNSGIDLSLLVRQMLFQLPVILALVASMVIVASRPNRTSRMVTWAILGLSISLLAAVGSPLVSTLLITNQNLKVDLRAQYSQVASLLFGLVRAVGFVFLAVAICIDRSPSSGQGFPLYQQPPAR